MNLSARIERLRRSAPCPACAGEAAGTVFKWLADDEDAPDTVEQGLNRCSACGRAVRRVQYIRWQRSEPPARVTPGERLPGAMKGDTR